MSLISEALRRAREHAVRHGDGAATPPPFPILPPPPRERPRNLIALSVATSLAVSLIVAGGAYLLLARPAAPPTQTLATASSPTPAASPEKSAATPREAAGDARPEPEKQHASRVQEAPRLEVANRPTLSPTPAVPSTPHSAAAPPPDPYPATTPTVATPPRPAPASAPAPPPTRGGDTRSPGVQLPDGTRVTLDGIVWGEAPFAMLNGRLVGPGERLGSLTLARIEPRRVTLLGDDGKTYVVDLVR